MQHLRRTSITAMIAAAALLAACGSDSPKVVVPTTTAPTVIDATTTTVGGTTETTEAAASGNSIESFTDVQPAVLQLQGAGSFREPGSDSEAVGWRGSGFFISPDGLAVTNNHVVSGAATLEVFAGGDTTKSYNATVVGASECNDLALVQVNVKEPVPYLDWASEDITPGLEIYLAGFPLGDPEYTLVKGIISKAKAGGETNWASIDETVQYDAQSQPGNSGGPVVDAQGDVVAVHYSGGDPGTGTNQFFGISAHLAQQVVDELRNGDFESIGINGKAFVDQEAGLAGIWVSGVAAGSAASKVGLLPGDIITKLNGLPVGQDGTMSSYCDVLRTAGAEPIGIEVLRFDTGELLAGELNGDKTLAVTQYLVSEDVPEDLPVTESYTYEGVIDDTGQIYLELPVQWAQRDTAGQTLSDGDHAAIIAAPDLNAFLDTDTATGILVAGFLGTDYSSVLTAYENALNCSEAGDVVDVTSGILTGKGIIYSGCGDTGGSTGLVVMGTQDGHAAILLISQLNSEADLEALNQAVGTLIYVPAI